EDGLELRSAKGIVRQIGSQACLKTQEVSCHFWIVVEYDVGLAHQ
ncbi:MAG: hypothetical protein ACI9G1_004894, partial [Pirellulaceae bacterium]